MSDATTEKALIDAALRLAAQRPWGEVTMRDIAEAAGSDLAEMRRHVSSPGALVAAFIRSVDDDVLRRAPRSAPDLPRRDVLFDIVMSRFDALAPHKAAVKSISSATALDPRIARALFSSQNWMLQAAGVRTDGLDGGVKIAALAAIYGSAFRTWLADDDPGLGRTMAVLDRGLRRAERTWRSLSDGWHALGRVAEAFRPGRSRPKGAPPEGADGPPSPGTEPSAPASGTRGSEPAASPAPPPDVPFPDSPASGRPASQRQADDGPESAH